MLTFYHRGQDAENRWKNIIPQFFTTEIGDMFQKHTHKNYLPSVRAKMKGDMPVTRGSPTSNGVSCNGRHVNPRCAILLIRFYLD